MMVPVRDVIEAVERWGSAALAWEVLRRDPAYIMAYATLQTPPAPGAAANAAFVAEWGLHFR